MQTLFREEKPMIHLIAAVGKQGQLGLQGRLPWHFPEDLKWFKAMTMDQVVVVGHRTAETLPPLPGRRIHVMSRGQSCQEVIEAFPGQDLWIIGGAATYLQWLPFVDRFHINKVDYDGPADTFMPPLFADRLHMLLNKHGVCSACGDLYEHFYDEPFAACGCGTSEWYSYTPHMRKLRKTGEALAAVAAHDRVLVDSGAAPTGEDYVTLIDILKEAMA